MLSIDTIENIKVTYSKVHFEIHQLTETSLVKPITAYYLKELGFDWDVKWAFDIRDGGSKETTLFPVHNSANGGRHDWNTRSRSSRHGSILCSAPTYEDLNFWLKSEYDLDYRTSVYKGWWKPEEVLIMKPTPLIEYPGDVQFKTEQEAVRFCLSIAVNLIYQYFLHTKQKED